MPRPKNKQQLLDLSQQNFDKLNALIDGFSPAEQEVEFTGDSMNRNIRDTLGHLYFWHLMMLEWYAIGMAGNKPDMPAKGYTWKDTSSLNHEIWKKCQAETLPEIRQKLEGSHAQVYQLIEQHSDEELFEKKRYKWTGSTSLGAYLISSTSSHYDWALKLIKKGKKPVPAN